MSKLSNRQYYNQVDEAFVIYGGGASCVQIDPRMWSDFSDKYKELNEETPKPSEWSYDAVSDWMNEQNEETA